MHSPLSLSWLRRPQLLFWLSRSTLGSSWRFKSRGPDFTNWFINPFIIFTFHRGLKIRIIRLRNWTAFTRTTIRHIYFASCTHVWRIRSHDQNRSVYGGWLTKLHVGQFSWRKKAQRGIRSTLYVSICYPRHLDGITKKWHFSRQLPFNFHWQHYLTLTSLPLLPQSFEC